ncbi:MAG: hypothetical protein GY862_36165 [Gammaproteobacteria bacterium]|nr:hypothetical protein [Gammaproteobacteria bacterium]
MLLASVAVRAELVISVVAGNGVAGYNGDGLSAAETMLNNPELTAIDAAGNLYIADSGNYRVRKLDRQGIISTLAGAGIDGYGGDGGPATDALLGGQIGGLAVYGDDIYIADTRNNRVRKVDANGIITTVAGNGAWGYSGDGGPAAEAQLHSPRGIAFDDVGNLYIADSNNHRIRKTDAANIITTAAGDGSSGYRDGPAAKAQFRTPVGVTVDAAGKLYIADTGNRRIRTVDADSMVHSIAGTGAWGGSGDGGPAAEAKFKSPSNIAVDNTGNLYIADPQSHRIRKFSPDGIISTIAGSGDKNVLNAPYGILADKQGNLYIADSGNQRIRKAVDPEAPKPAPEANFSVSAEIGNAPLAINLDAGASRAYGYGKIAAYRWQVGDQAVTAEMPLQRLAISQAGEYSILLSVTDSEGEKATTKRTVTVLPALLDYPSLGQAGMFYPSGQIASLPGSRYLGGILDDNFQFIPNGEIVQSGQFIRITVTVLLQPAHTGQLADVLMVFGYDNGQGMRAFTKAADERPAAPSGENFVPFMACDAASVCTTPWRSWDGGFSSVALARSGIRLEQTLTFSVFNGKLTNAPGTYVIFLGYRLNGTEQVVYNAETAIVFYVTG